MCLSSFYLLPTVCRTTHTQTFPLRHTPSCTGVNLQLRLVQVCDFQPRSFHSLPLCNVRWWEPKYDKEYMSPCLTGWPSGRGEASTTGGDASGRFSIMTNLPQNESTLAIYYGAGWEPRGPEWFQLLRPPASFIICLRKWQWIGHTVWIWLSVFTTSNQRIYFEC